MGQMLAQNKLELLASLAARFAIWLNSGQQDINSSDMKILQLILLNKKVVFFPLTFYLPSVWDAEVMIGDRAVFLVHEANLGIEVILL